MNWLENLADVAVSRGKPIFDIIEEYWYWLILAPIIYGIYLIVQKIGWI